MKPNERFLIIINPVGRAGYALKQGIWLLNRLHRMDVQHEAFVTKQPGHAERLVGQWIDRADVVVAVGGDGTVNEVINGMMNSGADGKRFAVFPAGTANDFARDVGIPLSPNAALQTMLGGKESKIDLLKVDGRYVAVTFGIGIDAEVAYKSFHSKRLRELAYWYNTFALLLKTSPPVSRLSIQMDNRQIEGEFLLTVVGNAGRYAKYVRILPDARMDDGIVNLVTIQTWSRLKGFLLGLLTLVGKHTLASGVSTASARELVIRCNQDVYAQMDGEAVMFQKGKELRVCVEPLALEVRTA
ncbi:MAG: diacylglycerol kinase family lipid kinase [Actinomycetota bacterium]|nr:diacylglycerol kinase family lipid kinase [Actinomycetota bacterium]